MSTPVSSRLVGQATYFGGDTLRGETKERWRELCEELMVERDPDKFLTRIEELLDVLDEREQRQRDGMLRTPLREKPYQFSSPVV